MRFRTFALAAIAAVAMLSAFAVSSEADIKRDLAEFKSVWGNRKATNLEKRAAVQALPTGNAELVDIYAEILESDVWQYRAEVMAKIINESNEDLLAGLEKWLLDEKKSGRAPAAAEHLIWAMYNNPRWATDEKWQLSARILRMDKLADKAKARMIRELGRWRGRLTIPLEEIPEKERPEDGKPVYDPQTQTRMRANAKVMVDLLGENLENRKANLQLRFLLIDSLEAISGQEHGDKIDNWRFWVDNPKPEEPLKPRKADTFSDQFTNVKIEGHSFVRKTARPTDMEILILPDLGSSEQYWYPYIFELNKTFKCTFVQLPDCSQMPDLETTAGGYYYPLKQLVETFEERRKQSKQERIGLVAHGASGWIAMQYLLDHPESVAFAIIMQTWSGQNSASQSINQCIGDNDPAWKYYGMSRQYDPSGRSGELSLNDEQRMWAQTGAYRRRWGDPKALEPILYSDSFAGLLGHSYRRPIEGGRVFIPKFEFTNDAKGKRVDVPVLFIHGAADPCYVKKDESDYKRAFTKMYWEVFPKAGDTPWAEEPVLFFEAFRKMLDDHDIIEKLKQEAEERKKREAEKKN